MFIFPLLVVSKETCKLSCEPKKRRNNKQMGNRALYSVTSPQVAKTYRFVAMEVLVQKLTSHIRSCPGRCVKCKVKPVCTNFSWTMRLYNNQEGSKYAVDCGMMYRLVGTWLRQCEYGGHLWNQKELRKLYRVGLTKETCDWLDTLP